ncbi:hypothetical protein [Candidatus Nitrosacidococcus tergens]|uniref:Uncharacterized protein n=1 Tax=Candidatus Nitrosacidococcus tergens TaxID=553981 RepID=A0A7G1Q9S4_9GAMM|nr:hypothetical protein [Candidatus Nitrosacidococcus tergens]CAB1275850.1 protein of unknown function [Candidatus Nitrosacidococcus tergens]
MVTKPLPELTPLNSTEFVAIDARKEGAPKPGLAPLVLPPPPPTLSSGVTSRPTPPQRW